MNYHSLGLSWQLSPRQMHGGFTGQPSPRMPIGLYTLTAVEYLPHNSESRRVAQSIAGLITTPANNLQIEHVGSTAVPGLPAKPVVDLMATVDSMALADRLIPRLLENGYVTSAEFNATLGDRRWLMRHADGHRTHHLHLVLPDSSAWRDTSSECSVMYFA